MNLLSIDSLTDADIAHLLEAGLSAFDNPAPSQQLGGKILLNLFYENSTRTSMSFAVAAQRLGATPIALSVEHSSVRKGETLEDTAATLDAMGPDAIVIRHRDNGAPARVAEIVRAPVINAGDGTNEHPTQALLDAATILHHFGRTDGLKVAICGDIRHSRVARSNALLLPRLGVEVRLAGPPALLPEQADVSGSVDEAIAGADVVMMLRVQRERLDDELGDAPGEYLSRYGLTPERLALAAPKAVVMHPGPMNRGVEIDGGVADSGRSLIVKQVAMGVAVRRACLAWVIGAA